jgi:hypothetical protein
MGTLDRYGEPVEDDDNQPELHDFRCVAGWLGDDEHDHPIPCLQCRPHLKRTT